MSSAWSGWWPDARDGDELVFHVSGHGSQVAARDGDELDKLDEITVTPIGSHATGSVLPSNSFLASCSFGLTSPHVSHVCKVHSEPGLLEN